jgi:phosphoglycerate dehydrogenase-like enzyme
VQLGLVGLGKMGAAMRDRLRAAGIEVLGYKRSPGSRDVDSLAELVDRLSTPRATSSSTGVTRATPRTRHTPTSSQPTASVTWTAVSPVGCGACTTATG